MAQRVEVGVGVAVVVEADVVHSKAQRSRVGLTGGLVILWVAGRGLWAAAAVSTGKLMLTVMPSRTSPAAATTRAGVR